MKVHRFRAKRIHGYLNFNIRFFPDITFLTGINGSGKTTVVNGISALISPSLSQLASTRYNEMEVDIELDNARLLKISAIQEEDIVTIKSSEDSDALRFSILRSDEGIPPQHAAEREREYYREQEARHASHPVLKRLKGLPTPMSLGLERRGSALWMSDDYLIVHPSRRRLHNAFSSSMSRSPLETAQLAERSFSLVQARQRDLTDQLKKQFILSALKYEPAIFTESSPPSLDAESILRIRNTLKEIGLSDNELNKHLNPFVDKLREISGFLPFDSHLQEVLSGPDKRKASAYLEWLTNKPQFDRLTALLREVDRYISDGQKASNPLTTYLEIINNFLKDSQLVVIITHLAFNPAAQSANVFIVDEPELSLHLRWQELFVSAVRNVNAKLQVILATHSPAIILDDESHCVDLSEVSER